jgi:transposase
MASMAYVGMDVHKETTRLVVLPADAAEPVDECTVATTQQALNHYLRPWAARYELRCVYEASGCGYVPQRWLAAVGIACTVIAPSKTPRGPGDRVKTDRRDARLLAR